MDILTEPEVVNKWHQWLTGINDSVAKLRLANELEAVQQAHKNGADEDVRFTFPIIKARALLREGVWSQEKFDNWLQDELADAKKAGIDVYDFDGTNWLLLQSGKEGV